MTRADPPPVARRSIAAIFLLFVLIALLSFIKSDPHAALSSDQINIGTIILKEQHPDAMPRDFVYGDERNFTFYTPAYRALVRFAAAIAGSYEGAMRLLLPFMVFIFLTGMFFLVRALTGSIPAAVATSLGAMTLRYSLAAETWGVGSIRLVVPGSAYLSLVPWLALLLWRWRGDRRVYAALFALGLSANLHPISGMVLIESYALVILMEGRFRPSAWGRTGLCLLAAAAGAAPFAVPYLTRPHSPEAADATRVLAAIDFRFNNLFVFKKLAWAVRAAAGMIVPGALAAIGVFGRRRTDRGPVRYPLILLAAVAVVSIGGSLAIEATMALANRPSFLIDQLRGSKYLYLPIFMLCGYGFEALLRRRRLLVAILFLLALQFSAPVHLPGKPDFGFDTLLTEIRPPGREEIPWLERTPSVSAAMLTLAAWARNDTRPDALFHGGDELFRYLAVRGITVTFKDGGFLFYANRPLFVQWYERMLESEPARVSGDLRRQEEAARRYGADYLIVRSSTTRGTLHVPVAFENGTYRVYDLGRIPS